MGGYRRSGQSDLEEFFLVGPARVRTEAETLEALRRALLPTQRMHETVTPEQHAKLVLTFWRLARAVLADLGHLAEDERLEQALLELRAKDPWTDPLPAKRAAPDVANNPLTGATSLLLVKAQLNGLTLLPPAQVDGEEADATWTSVMEKVFADLGLHRTDYDIFRLVSDCTVAPYVAPTPGQILAFEEMVVTEAADRIIGQGERPTIDYFREDYHLSRKEATALVRLARADAMAVGKSSVEEDRALCIAMLKEMVNKATASLNTNDALKAIKMLAQIQGLTRVDPENAGEDFAGVIARVAKTQDSALDRAAAMKAQVQAPALPGAVPDEAPYFDLAPEKPGGPPVMESDVLVEFDEEN